MRVFARVLFISVLIIAFQGCTDNRANVTLSGKTVEISSVIVPKFVNAGDGKSKIEGTLLMKNVTSVHQMIKTTALFLKVNGDITSPTYKAPTPSENSTGTIELNANSSLLFPAYWVYNVPAETKVKSLQFLYEESE